jgi:uncharacterized protein (TIGR01777 family)
MNSILITGGSGFLGSHLIPYLKSKGKSVSIIGRKIHPEHTSFTWDLNKKIMDESALSGIGSIIHLSGAGIADKRWTPSYKKEIINSRIKSAELLFNTLKKNNHQVRTLISASAVGYYGDSGSTWVEEDFKAPENFLGSTCIEWEKASKKFEELGIRVVIFRIGFILANDGGALPVMAKPVRFYIGSPLGSGEQYISWIHIDDLCRMFLLAIDDKKIHGVYNAVTQNPIQNSSFVKLIGKTLQRPVWPLNVPSFLLKMILGEKAALVLESQRVSSEKIRMTGFVFKHVDAEEALKSILK